MVARDAIAVINAGSSSIKLMSAVAVARPMRLKNQENLG